MMTHTLKITVLIHYVISSGMFGITDLGPVWKLFRPVIATPCAHYLPDLPFIELTTILPI